MEITLDKLRDIVGEALERGYNSCPELKDQDLQEIIDKSVSSQEAVKVWKVENLQALHVGTIFHHFGKGRCWIIGRPNGAKAMQFNDGTISLFSSNSFPWDIPMKLLYESK